jgi:hypothetical protein
MATTSRYTIAPPSVAPLLHEYGDWDNIPAPAWREYIAATAYWARCWRMYDDPDRPKRRVKSGGAVGTPPADDHPET